MADRRSFYATAGAGYVRHSASYVKSYTRRLGEQDGEPVGKRLVSDRHAAPLGEAADRHLGPPYLFWISALDAHGLALSHLVEQVVVGGARLVRRDGEVGDLVFRGAMNSYTVTPHPAPSPARGRGEI